MSKYYKPSQNLTKQAISVLHKDSKDIETVPFEPYQKQGDEFSKHSLYERA